MIKWVGKALEDGVSRQPSTKRLVYFVVMMAGILFLAVDLILHAKACWATKGLLEASQCGITDQWNWAFTSILAAATSGYVGNKFAERGKGGPDEPPAPTAPRAPRTTGEL